MNFSRVVLVVVTAALAQALVACASFFPAVVNKPVEYSAIQIIETVPGPFANRIYIAGERERQDASLGGKTVTTIVRRDKGVAWLLIPDKNQYEELELDSMERVSLQAGFTGLEKRPQGREYLDGVGTEKIAWFDSRGSLVAHTWVSGDGITRKAEIQEDLANGKPVAFITLRDVRIGKQDASLFELPAGYLKIDAR